MVLFFVRQANSVLFSLENGSSAWIQRLQYHGVGSFLRHLQVFLTDIIASHMAPFITIVTTNHFSHTEQGKLTI